MSSDRIFAMSFASVYPLYVQRVERKGRKKQELDQVICWLTGYSPKALAEQIKRQNDLRPSSTRHRSSIPTPARSRARSAGCVSKTSNTR